MKGRKDSHSSARPTGGPADGPDRSIAILGHELDNVLNGLLGMARLLRESDLSPEQDRWSRAIEQSGRQMRRLVSSFRGESRSIGPAADAARPVSSERQLDGIDLLEQVVFSQSPLAARRNNRLLLTVDAALPRFWQADPCRLRQLLDNLIGNANKFTENGEILLRAARLDCRADHGGLALAVMDSGPGVDPRAAPRIFEIGERGAGSTARRRPGSGLGLYVCREAVASMGGDIRLRPSPWGGAGFEVVLPGVLPPGGSPGAPHSRILGRLECRLELDGALRESVAGWLTRLGVTWRGAEAADTRRRRDRLCLRISELQADERPAPLLLEALPAQGVDTVARRLGAPVVGSTLGPLLLEMGLEWLWLSRGSRG